MYLSDLNLQFLISNIPRLYAINHFDCQSFLAGTLAVLTLMLLPIHRMFSPTVSQSNGPDKAAQHF